MYVHGLGRMHVQLSPVRRLDIMTDICMTRMLMASTFVIVDKPTKSEYSTVAQQCSMEVECANKAQ
jgi:hypothetical protein